MTLMPIGNHVNVSIVQRRHQNRKGPIVADLGKLLLHEMKQSSSEQIDRGLLEGNHRVEERLSMSGRLFSDISVRFPDVCVRQRNV